MIQLYVSNRDDYNDKNNEHEQFRSGRAYRTIAPSYLNSRRDPSINPGWTILKRSRLRNIGRKSKMPK